MQTGTNTGSGRYRLKDSVAATRHDHRLRLVDLEGGRFYALDPIGTDLLEGALDGRLDDAVARVASEYAVPSEQVFADWMVLLHDLRRRRLVVLPATWRRLPSRIRLAWLLAQAWLSVRLLGWGAAVRFWRRGREHVPGRSLPAQAGEVVHALDRAVQEAAAGHWLNVECKERALVGWYVLSAEFGLPAELVVGIIPFPFQAHAWVECGPWTITDERTQCDLYTPVAHYS